MQMYSRTILDQMGDQVLEGSPEKNGAGGFTVQVRRPWTLDDEEEWPEAAQWIMEQCARLQAILIASAAPRAVGEVQTGGQQPF